MVGLAVAKMIEFVVKRVAQDRVQALPKRELLRYHDDHNRHSRHYEENRFATLWRNLSLIIGPYVAKK